MLVTPGLPFLWRAQPIMRKRMMVMMIMKMVVVMMMMVMMMMMMTMMMMIFFGAVGQSRTRDTASLSVSCSLDVTIILFLIIG